jgi:hypothetical protein
MARRERCVLRVIEGRARPTRRVMAVLASCWEELRLRCMARVRRVVVVVLMASEAYGRQRRVVGVDMAIGALTWRHGMRASERERRVVVIEC